MPTLFEFSGGCPLTTTLEVAKFHCMDNQHIYAPFQNAIDGNRLGSAYLLSGDKKDDDSLSVSFDLNEVVYTLADMITDSSDKKSYTKVHSCYSNNGPRSMGQMLELMDVIDEGDGVAQVYILTEVHMLSSAAEELLLAELAVDRPNRTFLFTSSNLSKVQRRLLSMCQHFEVQPLEGAERI